MEEEVGPDKRPLAAVGHVTLKVTDVPRAANFYSRLGLRIVTEQSSMAILELRGGTHLMLFRARGTPRKGRIRSFDLMVDDVDPLRDALHEAGVKVSRVREDERSGHRFFEVRDPDGHAIRVNSNHTEGRLV